MARASSGTRPAVARRRLRQRFIDRADVARRAVQGDRDEGSRPATYFKELGVLAEKRNFPAWLNRDLKNLSGSVQRLPERAEIDGNLNEQLIVEYYSR